MFQASNERITYTKPSSAVMDELDRRIAGLEKLFHSKDRSKSEIRTDMLIGQIYALKEFKIWLENRQ